MTEVNQAMNDFISPIQYVDLKSKEECFTTVFFFVFPTALSEPLCRPSHDIYGFGSQQFNGISLTETNNMPSRFFISNRFLLGDFLAFIALNPRSHAADEIGMTESLHKKLFIKSKMLLLVNL